MKRSRAHSSEKTRKKGTFEGINGEISTIQRKIKSIRITEKTETKTKTTTTIRLQSSRQAEMDEIIEEKVREKVHKMRMDFERKVKQLEDYYEDKLKKAKPIKMSSSVYSIYS